MGAVVAAVVVVVGRWEFVGLKLDMVSMRLKMDRGMVLQVLESTWELSCLGRDARVEKGN